MVADVVFIGSHIYESRIVRDGYSIEDVLDQIASAMDSTAVVARTRERSNLQTTERYLGCKQTLRVAVNDHIGIEPED